jgi:hypothetical protein
VLREQFALKSALNSVLWRNGYMDALRDLLAMPTA